MLRLSIQFVIALVISLVMTAINYGLKGAFFQNWAKGFIVAFIIIPLALRLIPIIARGVRVVIGNRTPFVLRCVVSIMMEGLIALVVTFAQHGLTSGWPLVWATTVVKALPLGLLVGVTMTFIVQPRMQKLAASAPAN